MRKPDEFAPGSSYEQRAPIAEYLDCTEKYIVEFVDIDEETGRFKDDKTGEPSTSIIWKFHLWHKESGEPVMAQDGNPFEMIRFTPDGTWSNEKTGKKALTRQFIEALAGRALSDAEVASAIERGIARVLKGKQAIADLEEQIRFDVEGNEVVRYKITRLLPYKTSMAGAVNPQRRAVELAHGQPAAAVRSAAPQQPATRQASASGWPEAAPAQRTPPHGRVAPRTLHDDPDDSDVPF